MGETVLKGEAGHSVSIEDQVSGECKEDGAYCKNAVSYTHLDVYKRQVEYRSQEISDYIDAHPEYDNIVIVLSGDVGFYSGARKLLEVLCQDSADLRVQRKNGSEKSEMCIRDRYRLFQM